MKTYRVDIKKTVVFWDTVFVQAPSIEAARNIGIDHFQESEDRSFPESLAAVTTELKKMPVFSRDGIHY